MSNVETNKERALARYHEKMKDPHFRLAEQHRRKEKYHRRQREKYMRLAKIPPTK